MNIFFRLLITVFLSGCSTFISPPPHGLNPENPKQAWQSFHYAHHHKKYLDEQGRVSGFAPRYQLDQHPGTFYTHLAKHPDEVNLYAGLCYDIYAGLRLTHGKHMDVTEVQKAIGLQKLGKTGYEVIATFQRWHQFSGALLFNQKLNTLLVAFSGTSTSKDILMDLKFLRYHGRDKYGVAPKDYNVHAGVAQALIDSLDDFTPQFFYAVAKHSLRNKDLRIITMGHSLGGGIALLTADYLARHKKHIELKSNSQNNKIVIHTITFGAPRIFSKKTAQEVERRLGKGNVIRFWSSLDPVPALVSAVFTNSRHVGLNFQIRDNFWRYTLPGLGWHRIGWYKERAYACFCRYMWERQHRIDVEKQYQTTHQLFHTYSTSK